MELDWSRMISDARSSQEGMRHLMDLIKVDVCAMATCIDFRLRDDLQQIGLLAVWKAIFRVDLTRPATIRNYLLVSARRRMIDFLRKEKRHSSVVSSDLKGMQEDEDDCSMEFSGILSVYLEYIEKHGSIHGAHQHLARMLNVSKSTMWRRFHIAAEHFKREKDDEQR